jgi:chromosome segregation ATPase
MRVLGEVDEKLAEAEARIAALEAELALSDGIIEAIFTALHGKEVSEFEESFAPVRKAVDLAHRIAALEAAGAALKEELEEVTMQRDAVTEVLNGSSSHAHLDAYRKVDVELHESAMKRIAELEAAPQRLNTLVTILLREQAEWSEQWEQHEDPWPYLNGCRTVLEQFAQAVRDIDNPKNEHALKCCKIHGCYYGAMDPFCSVELGWWEPLNQEYCERCFEVAAWAAEEEEEDAPLAGKE